MPGTFTSAKPTVYCAPPAIAGGPIAAVPFARVSVALWML